MSFSVTIAPSGRAFTMQRDETVLGAAINAGIGLPYGCKDGACGSCKCKLIEGRVIHGAHQAKALSAAEEDAGYMLTCCATPQTDLVIEARQVVGIGDHPVVKMPTRVTSLHRAAPDVMVLRLQLPATHNFGFRAGQYIEFVLKDGHRRSYSMANSPEEVKAAGVNGLELHVRHMPGGLFTDHVFGAMKEKDILRVEGPFGTFFLRDDSERPIVLRTGRAGRPAPRGGPGLCGHAICLRAWPRTARARNATRAARPSVVRPIRAGTGRPCCGSPSTAR